MKCDVAIIGAGMSGVSCAHAIACEGELGIILLEARRAGVNNPTPLTFASVVKENALEDYVKGRYSSFAFHNFGGSIIRYFFDGFPLMALDYQEACTKLLERITKEQPHVSVVKGLGAKVFQKDRSITIELEDGRSIEASILIDCSGAAQFGLSQLSDGQSSYYSHPYGAIFSNVDPVVEEDLAFFLLPNERLGSGGGWFYPIHQGRASFGYAIISKERKTDLERLVNGFNTALREFEPYAKYLRDSQLECVETGTIPLTYASRLVHGRMVLVGDAAGIATNWTCMGVEPALKYGKLAGSVVARAVLKRDMELLHELEIIWSKENRNTYDEMNHLADRFWTSGPEFWEWIVLNDLAHLSPKQVVERMRWNSHLPSKPQLFFRALLHKVRSILDKDAGQPRAILIRK